MTYPHAPSTAAVSITPTVIEHSGSNHAHTSDSTPYSFRPNGNNSRPSLSWKGMINGQVAGFDTHTAAAASGMFPRHNTAKVAATSVWIGAGGNIDTARPSASPSEEACRSGRHNRRCNTFCANQCRQPLSKRYRGRRSARYAPRTNFLQCCLTLSITSLTAPDVRAAG